MSYGRRRPLQFPVTPSPYRCVVALRTIRNLMIQWWFLMKTGRAQRPLIFRYRGASGRQSIRQVYNWTESKQFIVGDDIDVAGTGAGQRRETKRRTFRK